VINNLNVVVKDGLAINGDVFFKGDRVGESSRDVEGNFAKRRMRRLGLISEDRVMRGGRSFQIGEETRVDKAKGGERENGQREEEGEEGMKREEGFIVCITLLVR